MEEILQLLNKPEFPRSRRCKPDWMLDNQMGPNAVWLVEWLSQAMDLKPGMRVLDLGCGRAMTSIFLAQEFGVRVWATDLWIGPDANWQRAVEAGVGELVCPLRAEAHSMPFAQGFFDAVISVDAFQYFGTDELYLGYLTRFVKPNGALGVVMPGLTQSMDSGVPEHLIKPQQNGKVFWEPECISFHTAEWWQSLWMRTCRVQVERADTLPDGWRHWRDFERALERTGKSIFPSDVETLERDQGRYIGLVRLVARRSGDVGENLYDPNVGVRVGVDR